MSHFILGLALCIAAPAGDDNDAIRAQLAKGRKAHEEACKKAREALQNAFEEAVKSVAQAGDLDGVKAVQAEGKAFKETGKLPTSPRMRTAAADYQKSLKQATDALDKAYEQAIKDLTKALRIEDAETVREEWKQARRGDGDEPKAALTPAGAFEYKFYEWNKGDAPVKMIHKDEGFCYLVGINGALAGGGESVQITIEKDGYWYLKGHSLNKQMLNARAVSVKLLRK